MNPTMFQQAFILFGLILALTLIHIAGFVIACLACRIGVDRVSIFYGKAIATIQTPLCPVAIGWLPCGASVSLDVENLDKRPFLVRCVVLLSGVVALLLAAGVCLRIDVAVSEIWSGFIQIVLGAVSPFERGTPLVRAFFQQADVSLLLGGGLLASKSAAFHLLTLTGGRVLAEIATNGRKRGLWLLCNLLGACMGFVMILCWLAALVNFWWQP